MRILANRTLLLALVVALSAVLAGCGSEAQVISQPTMTPESLGLTPTAMGSGEATQSAPTSEPTTVAQATGTAALPTVVPATSEPTPATEVSALPSMIFFSAPN